MIFPLQRSYSKIPSIIIPTIPAISSHISISFHLRLKDKLLLGLLLASQYGRRIKPLAL